VGRLVPLTGILAVAFVVVSAVVGGETPDVDDSLEEVVSFYTENDSDQMFAGALLAYGAFFFLCFASVLRRTLRRAELEAGGTSTLSFAGAIIFAVGLLIFAGIGFTIGDTADDIDPSALQTLHVLNADLFFPVAVGALAFLVGTGIAVLRTGALPRWLGWVAIVAGPFAATPLFFVTAFVLGLWILVVSVLLYRAGAETGAGPAPPPPVAP
jgi:hypothetical protein